MRRLLVTLRHPLILPLVVCVLWNLWAIAVDDMPSQIDATFSLRAVRTARSLAAGDLDGLSQLVAADKMMPLPVAVASLLVLLLGPSLFALRLGGVLAHAVAIWQSYDLARQAGGSPRACRWAAVAMGTSPLVFAWARLEYSDVYCMVFFAATLQVMIRGRLDGRRAVILGVVAGLGLLTRLSFAVALLAPGLWFLGGHLQKRRDTLMLALAVGVALLVGGWWYVLRWDVFNVNFLSSTQALLHDAQYARGRTVLERKLHQAWLYLWDLRGVAALWLGAASTLVVLRRIYVARALALLGLGSLVALMLFLAFDTGPGRYIVPIVPPTAVLAGLFAGHMLDVAHRRWRAPVEATLAIAVLSWFVALQLPRDVRIPRFEHDGMLAPVSDFVETCRLMGAMRVNVEQCDASLREWLTSDVFGTCRFPGTRSDRTVPCTIFIQPRWISERDEDPAATPGCPETEKLVAFGRRVGVRFAPRRTGDPLCTR